MKRLRQLRMQKGLTQNEFAARFGITQNAVSRYESGTNDPSIQQLIDFAQFFEVSVDYLVSNTDMPQRDKKPDNLPADQFNRAAYNVVKDLSEQQLAYVNAYVSGLIAQRH